MADDPRPAPVVTIVDPTQPGELSDVLQSSEPPPRLTGVQVIASALVLLLLAGIVSALALTHDQRRDRELARTALTRASFGLQLVGVATDHRVALVFALSNTGRAKVVGTDVHGGAWRSRGRGTPVGALDVHGVAVSLTSEVDCEAVLVPPTAARATLELDGQRRTVDLLRGADLAAVVGNAARDACGDVLAPQALELKASGATTSGDAVHLELVLTNRSTHDVDVTAIVVDGVVVQSSLTLPLLIPKRMAGARFVLDNEPQEKRIVDLTLRIKECLAVGQVGSDGYGEALTVEVTVLGKGGRGTTQVSSAGLQEQVAALVRQRCGR